MRGRFHMGAALVAAFLTVPLATTAGADLVDNNLVLSSNPAFNPVPGNDNGTTFEVIEVPVGGTATVNIEMIPGPSPDVVCDFTPVNPLTLIVTPGLASNPLVASVSTVLGRPITPAPSATRATVSPTQMTFTGCNAPQTLTVTGGPVVNEATSVTFGNVTGVNPCQPGSTCALAGRFVVVTRARNIQSLPGEVNQSVNWALRDSLTTGGPTTTFTYGTRPPALVPLSGDWDGDGTKTPGIFQAGVFKLSNSLTTSLNPADTFTFGDPRGFPVAGDFDGDGRDDVAVYRAGKWQIRLTVSGVPLPEFLFGAGSWPATVPVAGDWDGNGTDGIGTYNLMGPGTVGEWNLRQTASPGPADAGTFAYGGAGLYPVVGDWDANMTDTVGIKIMATNAWALNNQNDASVAEVTFNFGTANSLPVIWKKA